MIAWINLAVLIFSSLLFLYFYVLSVSPAAFERVIGPEAYRRCGHLRVVAILFEVVTVCGYVVYYFYPLPVPWPQTFTWPWWLSGLVGVVIGVPATYLMVVGMKDAGEEAIRPKAEHTMYSGIYEKVRHPQAAGEVFLWLVIAFLLHSPFLVLFSLIYFPIFLVMCLAEDHDLILRFGDPYAEYIRTTGAFFPKRI
jgi:protein-S-isoprenylcysteine O-methyltransferase Ste14